MNRRLKPIVFSTASLVGVLLGATAVHAATTCAGLINVSLPHGQVTAAQTITGGTFNTPPGCTTVSTGCTTNTGLPQFCRVAGTAAPEVMPPPRRTTAARREDSRPSLWVTPRRLSTSAIARSKKRPTSPRPS